MNFHSTTDEAEEEIDVVGVAPPTVLPYDEKKVSIRYFS